jgi:hypothetical protein
MQLDTIASIAGIDQLGTFDYAVPMNWLMQDPEKHRHYCWYYAQGKKPGALWGRPLAWRAVGRLALRVLRARGISATKSLDNYLRIWAYVYPGKTLDKPGIEAVNHYIQHASDVEQFNIQCILDYYKIPPPAPGELKEYSQAA